MRHALMLLAGLALAGVPLAGPVAAAPVPRDRVPEKRPPGYLGIFLVDDFNGTGARVTGVLDGSPAAAAGFRENDVVTSVNGAAVPDAATLMATVKAKRQGDEVTVSVTRPGGVVVLRAKLAARPPDPAPDLPPPLPPP